MLAGSIYGLIARPWMDASLYTVLKHGFFPLSRLWAAGLAAGGDVDRFWHEAGLPRRHEVRDRLAATLARVEAVRSAAHATDADWERALFDEPDPTAARAAAAEAARLDHRDLLNRLRGQFFFLRSHRVPRARLEVPTPRDVAALYPPGADPASFTQAPELMPAVVESRRLETAAGTDHWIAFQSPLARLSDRVIARVHTPAGIDDPPTVILGHGICVEFDHWHGLIDETPALLAAGFRVIRPEAPWHGRRTPVGRYGGEQAIGNSPLGMLDLILGAVREWAVLANYARRTSLGPLAFAGTSLGALTAQRSATASRDWPETLRPDALYLITHSGNMSEAMVEGAASRMFADVSVGVERGWTADGMSRALAPIDPGGQPPLPPSRIVSVLGRRDVITPFAGGHALVARWGVPEENVFISDRGHFTIPMSLKRDGRPTERFVEILRSL